MEVGTSSLLRNTFSQRRRVYRQLDALREVKVGKSGREEEKRVLGIPAAALRLSLGLSQQDRGRKFLS